jgi:hypothetical protein
MKFNNGRRKKWLRGSTLNPGALGSLGLLYDLGVDLFMISEAYG